MPVKTTTKMIISGNGLSLKIEKPAVMGIVNLTPDSFYDGGSNNTLDDFLDQIDKMIIHGASIIDLGAVSTRPGAPNVDQLEENRRLLPALQKIRAEFPEIMISVDTYRSEIAKMAVAEGANLINDISAGSFDKNMFSVVANAGVPYIAMHIQGTPQNMQLKPSYGNVVAEVRDFLTEQAHQAKSQGVATVIIDPGFGFGKTVDHNFQLLKNLETFTDTGYPVLAGISRKSMINKILGTKPKNALNGTTVLHTIALLKGVRILRAHDVKEAVEAVKLVDKYLEV